MECLVSYKPARYSKIDDVLSDWKVKSQKVVSFLSMYNTKHIHENILCRDILCACGQRQEATVARK
jgi:hypothetical protein